jgi:hypothetical protein
VPKPLDDEKLRLIIYKIVEHHGKKYQAANN